MDNNEKNIPKCFFSYIILQNRTVCKPHVLYQMECVENTITPLIIRTRTGCYQGWQELSSDYLLFATFLVTGEDAKAYLYSMSSKRRVHKWKDIQVNLYI